MANQGFDLAVRPDRIIVYKLHNFSRKTIIAWMEYVTANNGKVVPPIRLLFDFTDAGLPSQFLLDTIHPFMQTLDVPSDTRIAYVFPDQYSRFSLSFIRRMPADKGILRSFNDEGMAVDWLLSEIETSAD